MPIARPSSPSALRNRGPIAEILQAVLPATGKALEIASGTGEHALYFAEHFPQNLWQPSDASPEAVAAIESWRATADLPNLLPALELDATSPENWPDIDDVSAILCINMVHISPWSATEGLMRGAAKLLAPGEPLILYGPYIRAGVETAPSNLAFDANLKQRNPAWGLRALENVAGLAGDYGFALDDIIPMPANNISAILRKRP